MKPPACVSCKWGKGTTCEKPTNSQSSKEVTTKLEQMMAERAKQDAKWFAIPQDTSEQISAPLQQTKNLTHK
jgi:hypothetical protein